MEAGERVLPSIHSPKPVGAWKRHPCGYSIDSLALTSSKKPGVHGKVLREMREPTGDELTFVGAKRGAGEQEPVESPFLGGESFSMLIQG